MLKKKIPHAPTLISINPFHVLCLEKKNDFFYFVCLKEINYAK